MKPNRREFLASALALAGQAGFQRPRAPITPPVPYETMYKPSDVQLPPSANDTLEGKPAEQLAVAGDFEIPVLLKDQSKINQAQADP